MEKTVKVFEKIIKVCRWLQVLVTLIALILYGTTKDTDFLYTTLLGFFFIILRLCVQSKDN